MGGNFDPVRGGGGMGISGWREFVSRRHGEGRYVSMKRVVYRKNVDGEIICLYILDTSFFLLCSARVLSELLKGLKKVKRCILK